MDILLSILNQRISQIGMQKIMGKTMSWNICQDRNSRIMSSPQSYPIWSNENKTWNRPFRDWSRTSVLPVQWHCQIYHIHPSVLILAMKWYPPPPDLHTPFTITPFRCWMKPPHFPFWELHVSNPNLTFPPTTTGKSSEKIYKSSS